MSRIKLVWQDNEALNHAAAAYFVLFANKAIATKGNFFVALAGGNTPKNLYQLLATPNISRNINWKKVFLFWGDERFVPHAHEDSNYRMVKETLLDFVPIPKKNVFAIPTKGKPEQCAEDYEKLIKNTLGKDLSFDLTLLGMGEDGHTASLFPETEILNEKKRLVKEVWVESKNTWRISFTYPLLNRSREILFLISGENKAPILKKIFSNRKRKYSFPVENVQALNGQTTWLLDIDADSR